MPSSICVSCRDSVHNHVCNNVRLSRDEAGGDELNSLTANTLDSTGEVFVAKMTDADESVVALGDLDSSMRTQLEQTADPTLPPTESMSVRESRTRPAKATNTVAFWDSISTDHSSSTSDSEYSSNTSDSDSSSTDHGSSDSTVSRTSAQEHALKWHRQRKFQ
jgi:hypothetical protein